MDRALQDGRHHDMGLELAQNILRFTPGVGADADHRPDRAGRRQEFAPALHLSPRRIFADIGAGLHHQPKRVDLDLGLTRSGRSGLNPEPSLDLAPLFLGSRFKI